MNNCEQKYDIANSFIQKFHELFRSISEFYSNGNKRILKNEERSL